VLLTTNPPTRHDAFGDIALTEDRASDDGPADRGADTLVPILHMQSGVSTPVALRPAFGDKRVSGSAGPAIAFL
jgi:hypothetical protein